MKLRSLSLLAVLILLFSAGVPSVALADSKRPSDKNNGVSSKVEKVRCRSTDATTRFPKPVETPKGLSKRLPSLISLETNCGLIVIETLNRQAPVTINVLARLIRSGFYDKTLCHRLTTEDYYFLQCGDPTGTGLGGPDFEYRAENVPIGREILYPEGTVAMFNLSPKMNGSQFLIFYEDTTLPVGYTVWGRVILGLNIVQFIADAGVRGGETDGPPLKKIAIERATFSN